MSSTWPYCQVSEIVRRRLGRSRVLEKYGIDFCCHGDQSLLEACQTRGVDLDTVCRDLEKSDKAGAGQSEPDWSEATLTDLADHIVGQHHAYLRSELPRLGALIARVVEAHAEKHSSLVQLQAVFQGLVDELGAHMMKEEQVLFPIVKQLESAHEKSLTLPGFHCGSVNNPISVMMEEHENAGTALADMRRLTDEYTAPADACPSYEALLEALEQLEADMHIHIHKENNILFPRAARLESGMAAVT